MKYLNVILTVIAVCLVLILFKLDKMQQSCANNNKSLIASNQQLGLSVDEFRKLLEPIVKRYFKR